MENEYSFKMKKKKLIYEWNRKSLVDVLDTLYHAKFSLILIDE